MQHWGMIIESVKFRGHRCFKNEWSGFDVVKPINVIIGRNNTGKSHLLDLVSALCGKFYDEGKKNGWEYLCRGIPDEKVLKANFSGDTVFHSGAYIDRWRAIGQFLVGKQMTWKVDKTTTINEMPHLEAIEQQIDNVIFQGLDKESYPALGAIALDARHKLANKIFRPLLAERDIRPHVASNDLKLSPTGEGATNIIYRYIHSTDPKVSRALIQTTLRTALNEIFGNDGRFNEIDAKIHDGSHYGHPINSWEIFLGEEKKGEPIALSRSGSGLKTVILVLLNLLVIPEIDGKAKEQYVFAFEELENNLHPALLRRLFRFLETYATKEKATIFLTTHSSAALDFFGTSPNAQIVHVTHDGESAKAETVSAHFERIGIISELGAKPSDLLQANGIVWVEGPSDRVYLNRLIEIFSDGKWKEGRDYQCAFYGGALLARTQFVSPQDEQRELANLLRVNPNIFVICDSDRTHAGASIKDRVQRIQLEVNRIPNAGIWVTEAKEIENYLPGAVFAKAMKLPNLPDPGQYETIYPKGTEASYIEKNLNRKNLDKMELAIQAIPHMTKELMSQRFDLAKQMESIVGKIRVWNL